MPNRIIKESIRTSKTVNAMSDFQFRLWAYLITYVDDYGRGSADPELLKGFVFPRRKGVTESTIEKTLAELATIGSIHLYEVDGESYLCFPNWGDHQRIQQKKSKFPPPPAKNNSIRKSTVTYGELPPESNPIQSESEYKSEPESEPAHAGAAGDDSRPDFNTVEVYAANNLAVMNGANMQEFAAFKDDLPEELIRHAIDEACAQGKRTWSYVRAILNRYRDSGFKTVGDAKADAAKRSCGSNKSKPRDDLNYQQHEYKQEDFGDDFFLDPIAYMNNPDEEIKRHKEYE